LNATKTYQRNDSESDEDEVRLRKKTKTNGRQSNGRYALQRDNSRREESDEDSY
jgi:hypothetical protein